MSANDAKSMLEKETASNQLTVADPRTMDDLREESISLSSDLQEDQESLDVGENESILSRTICKSPINSDDEWDTDLETEDHAEEFDATGRKIYLSCCKTLNVIPVSYFLRHIQDPCVNLRHRGLGSKGAKALAISLVLNTSITSLDLHDNALEADGGIYIADMLRENCFLTELDISSNNLRSRGCQAICEMLLTNTSLLKINLANNGFTDKDSKNVAEAMRGNDKVAWLDLSNNQFSENSGPNFGQAIMSNDSVEHLDLSWNLLRKKTASEISNGLRTNCTIKTLNLSFNGFADEGTAALGEALKYNNTLTELDISNNRITNQGALFLAKGLEGNNTLEILKIGCNPIRTDGLVAIVNATLSYCDSALTTLHCKDIYLDSQFISLLREVKKVKPEFQVFPSPRAGGRDPLKTLRSFIAENKEKWFDICKVYDDGKSNFVSRRSFADAIQKTGLKLEVDEVTRLLSQLDPTKQGLVHYRHARLGFDFPMKQTPDRE